MASEQPQVIVSAFADEAANQKTAEQQFSALAAAGLQYYSLRFIDAGGGIKNVMKLSRSEITKIRHLEDEYGLNVTCIGSPLGKVKLVGSGGRDEQCVRAVQKVFGQRRETGMRTRACVRDKTDSRIFVLSSQGGRSAKICGAGGGPVGTNRRRPAIDRI